jgi:hypothetical protein
VRSGYHGSPAAGMRGSERLGLDPGKRVAWIGFRTAMSAR